MVPSPLRQRVPEGDVTQRLVDRRRQGHRIGSRDEPAGPPGEDEFGDSAHVGGDHRRPHCHGLEHDVGKALGQRRIHHQVGPRQRPHDVLAESGEDDAVLQTESGDLRAQRRLFSPRPEQEDVNPWVQTRDRFHQEAMGLLGAETPGGDGDECFRGEPVLAAQIQGLDAALAIDGVVDDLDAFGTDPLALEHRRRGLRNGDQVSTPAQYPPVEPLVDPDLPIFAGESPHHRDRPGRGSRGRPSADQIGFVAVGQQDLDAPGPQLPADLAHRARVERAAGVDDKGFQTTLPRPIEDLDRGPALPKRADGHRPARFPQAHAEFEDLFLGTPGKIAGDEMGDRARTLFGGGHGSFGGHGFSCSSRDRIESARHEHSSRQCERPSRRRPWMTVSAVVSYAPPTIEKPRNPMRKDPPVCGIAGIHSPEGGAPALRERALHMARVLRHRGPDWSGLFVAEHAVLAHERLAIVGVDSGEQPLLSADGSVALAVNGEIYNHRELRARHAPDVPCRTGSDCEVILPLYERMGAEAVARLNGIFAFVLHDTRSGHCLVARDPIGVVPLYTGTDAQGRRYFASEMKALIEHCVHLEEFPPGHVWDSREPAPRRYFHPDWAEADFIAESAVGPAEIHAALDAAVRRQLMCDVPYGVLLSGGLDSSVVAACAARHARRRVEEDERAEAWWPRIHSFAIGLEGSPDLAAAAIAAEALDTVHHPFVYTLDQGLDALRDVIHHLETFDVTTIRAATPMMLMARRIKAMGVKMVLSGEGSDEIFGGYLYFHKAPDEAAFHQETVRKIFQLHWYDCLRANKSMAAWGVEARVPFLDLEFLDLAMHVATRDKMIRNGRPEKAILREAFADWLPGRIVWRQKEQFSDGVGYGWIDALRDLAEREVSDTEMAAAQERFPIGTPWTKEGYYYRRIFDELFDHPDAAACVPAQKSIACSSPAALEWDESFRESADPSGRAIRDVHESAED